MYVCLIDIGIGSGSTTPPISTPSNASQQLQPKSEPQNRQAVQALQGEKTVIIVAHRLSTVEYCDRLYRLESSRIVDEGTFEELMSRAKDIPRNN